MKSTNTIRKLVNIEYSIFILYKKIIELEALLKTNTDEYKSINEYLKDLYIMEKEYLDILNDNYNLLEVNKNTLEISKISNEI